MTSERFALQAWSKAESHLAEAMAQRPEVTPNATVHLAYYAMFQAARASLLKAVGSAPKKHASVISQFGLLIREGSAELRQAGHDLRTVEASRIVADYGTTGSVGPEDAWSALSKARSFLDLCTREFGFPRSPRGENG